MLTPVAGTFTFGCCSHSVCFVRHLTRGPVGCPTPADPQRSWGTRTCCDNRLTGYVYAFRRVSLDFSVYDTEMRVNGMSDNEEESVRQEALAEEQFLLVELPAALRKIRAKAKGNEKLARKLVFGKLKYTGPEASFSSSHASVMKALDECFHVIVGKAADEIDKTRELLKELKREV
jgi:hypothetical protein